MGCIHSARQVLAFVEDKTVVGFAPLFLPADPILRTARLIGTGGSDYLDLLALPGTEAEVFIVPRRR